MKIGDIVRLRSGGPPMTVTARRETDAGHNIRAECWLDHVQRRETLDLPEACFEPVQVWTPGKASS